MKTQKIFIFSYIFLILLTFNSYAQNIEGAKTAVSNVRGANFPKVLPDNRVLFQISAPEAKKVQIDLGKLYDMQRDENGVWSVTTDKQGPGFHYYSLVIDGVYVADPASETFYGMGRMASGIEIPDYENDYHTLKKVPHGELRSKWYFSNITNSWRRFFIYTPPGYDDYTMERFPVLYILHGGGEDERGWANQGRIDIILDNLIAEGTVEPMVAVIPDGNIATKDFGEDFLEAFKDELIKNIIPFVEKNYKVLNTSKKRALAGLSMGGLQTLYTGIYNTNLFGYLGVFSSGWLPFQNEIAEKQYEFMNINAPLINSNLKLFFIAMGGKEDIAWENCQTMLKRFDTLNIKYSYYEFPGGHTWPVWRDNLYRMAPLLFK